MKALKLRTTVERTNPQLIREIRVDYDTDLDELARIIGISYGLKDVSGSWRNQKDVSLGGRLKVRDRLNENESLYFSINPTKTVPLRDGRVFVDFIEIEDVDEEAGNVCPEVTYVNGYNLSARADSIASLNRAYFSIEKTGDYAELGGRRWMPLEYNADLRRINAALNGKQESVDIVELDPYCFYSARDHLNTMTVGKLKMLALNLGLYSYGKKAQLVEDINQCFASREFLLWVLKDFTYEQYLEFRDHFAGKKQVSIGQTLSKWRYLYSAEIIAIDKFDNTVMIANTFAQNFQNWLNEGKEEAFYAVLKVASAVAVSCYLYGYCDRASAELLYKARFGEEFTEESWLECLADLSANVGMGFTKSRDGLIHISDYISKGDVEFIRAASNNLDIDFYIPSEDEFDDVARNGICFTKAEMNKLEGILEKDDCILSQSQLEQIRSMAYFLSLEKDEDELIRKMEQVSWYDFSKSAYNSLKKQLATISKRLPKARLKGHNI